MSPQGGNPPIDGFDAKDPASKALYDNGTYRYKIENTMEPADVNPNNYLAIYYAGGHGAMWDFTDNIALAKITKQIYEANGIAAAVCHGSSGLLGIELSNKKLLIDKKKVTGFSNEEETEVKLDTVVPYMLETKLIERGAIFEKTAPWTTHVVVDQRLITGQNPQSATAVGEAMLSEIKKLDQ